MGSLGRPSMATSHATKLPSTMTRSNRRRVLSLCAILTATPNPCDEPRMSSLAAPPMTAGTSAHVPYEKKVVPSVCRLRVTSPPEGRRSSRTPCTAPPHERITSLTSVEVWSGGEMKPAETPSGTLSSPSRSGVQVKPAPRQLPSECSMNLSKEGDTIAPLALASSKNRRNGREEESAAIVARALFPSLLVSEVSLYGLQG
eukprot:scaffold248944_cov31-Tisochrysis_lutea.AAC.3